MALDTTYSYLAGHLAEAEWRRVLSILEALGFELAAPELAAHLDDPAHPRSVLRGLAEFREHLGGRLTIMLLRAIGSSFEVHEMDPALVARAAALIESETPAPVPMGEIPIGEMKDGHTHICLSPEQAAISR
jgi:3-dehydroquinate synthase